MKKENNCLTIKKRRELINLEKLVGFLKEYKKAY